MTLTELLPTIQTLSRADRLHLVQVLVADLAREDDTPLLIEGQEYPVWSPFGATEAAAILEQELRENRGTV